MSRALLLRQSSPLAFPGRAPGFDPNHAASAGISPNKGLSAVSVGGNFISLLTGKPGTLTSTPPAVVDGAIGKATNFVTGTTQMVSFAGQSTAAATSITFAAILRLTTFGSGGNANIYTHGTALNWFFFNPSGGDFAVLVNGTQINSGIFPAAGVPYFCIASCLAAKTVTFLVLNLNTGQVQTAVATTTASAVASTASHNIGNWVTSSSPMLGVISAVMYAPRALSLPQMLQWARDPWSFWYPRKLDLTMMLSAGSGAAAYTLAGAEGAFSISGQTATTSAARKMAGVEGSFSISGQAAALVHNYKLSGAEGSFTISGQASAELRGIKMGGGEGAFVISGQAATLTLTTSGHYTLAGAEGSFSISGQAATLAAARKIAGAEGSFTISGQAGTLNAARKLAGIEGSFTISGQSSSELRGIKLAGAEGAFTISGGAATLGHGLHLAGAEGSFTISGQAAKFAVALSMPAVEGSFTISGNAAVLAYTPAGGGGATLPHSNPFFSTPGPGMALP